MKKLVYIGLLLLVISLVAYYSIYSSILSQTTSASSQNFTKVYDNFTLSGNSINILLFNSTAHNATIYVSNSNHPLNMFLLNKTGYDALENSITKNSSVSTDFKIVEGLEGRGAIMIYQNATNVTIPATFEKPVYTINDSNLSLGLLGSGRFYITTTLYNPSGASPVTVKSTLVSNVAISNALGSAEGLSVEGIAVTILLISSFVIILIGLLKQDKKKLKEEINPEVIDDLYRGIKTHPKKETAEKPIPSEKKSVKKGK